VAAVSFASSFSLYSHSSACLATSMDAGEDASRWSMLKYLPGY
jgi:hypothetical protein